MWRVLVASPEGPRLYELTDEEYGRFDYLLALARPADRGGWALRFLREREPVRVFPPGARGTQEIADIGVDRAIGGNFFSSKWGQIEGGRTGPPASRTSENA
ncbi:MAG: hypothetical protein M3506_03240 [Chloroflexota bacterium]|nr:hypothetical protein [Chloroflexota bacterium]